MSGSVSAAKSRVMQARMQIEAGRLDEVEATLQAAEGFLEGLDDDETAPITADIAAIRAEVSGPPAAAQPPPVEMAQTGGLTAGVTDVADVPAGEQAAAPAVDPAPASLSDDDIASALSRARSRVMQAGQLLESGRTENIEYTLQEAEEALAPLPDSAKATLLADIQRLRADTGGAAAAEDVRRVSEELTRNIDSADSNIEPHPTHAAETLDLAAERLNADDVRQALSADVIDQFAARIADVRARLAASLKADALERALPVLGELEERLATDPFAGLDQPAAYRATSELQTLRSRARGAIGRLPADDPDVVAIAERLVATDRKIDAASAAWGKAELEAQVSNDWDTIEQDIAGWQDEGGDSGAPRLEEPHLPKTRLAVRRIRMWLDNPAVNATRREHAPDPFLSQVYSTAEGILAAAAEKLAAAYDHVLDEAERMDTPMRHFELDRPQLLAFGADAALAGTTHQERIVRRALQLDERWKAEVAAIMQARQELYDRLAAEASAAWPAIVAATGAREDFNPASTETGSTVLLSGVYNRAGWDFAGGDADFSMRYDGVVIAGNYEAHVLEALEHAWYELKLDVSDRIPWDVVAIVDGPGEIGERTTVTLRDRDTNLEIGKIEEYRPVDCVRLSITALHAGPVAAGPRT